MGIASGLRVMSLFVAYAGVGWTGDQLSQAFARDSGSERRVVIDIDIDRDFEHEIEHVIEREVRIEMRSLRGEECAVELEREVSIPFGAATLVVVDAGAGALRVEGVDGATEVRAIGRVCASSEALAEELLLTLEPQGSELRLSAHYPDDDRTWGGGNRTARIDLTVTVPRGTALDIDDTSGEIEVFGSGELRIDDSSGEILVRGAAGPVTIDDSSGEIRLEDVSGDVDIEDGSGEIEVRSVRGAVRLRDGSGSIDVAEVTGMVRIDADGSGSIEVRDVEGDFIVDRDGSGDIRYSGVSGTVDVPVRERDRRARRDL